MQLNIYFSSILNLLLSLLRTDDFRIHWNLQRFSALSFLTLAIASIFLKSSYLFVLCIIFISYHAYAGIETLIDDYIHDEVQSVLSITFLRISILFLLKFVVITIII